MDVLRSHGLGEILTLERTAEDYGKDNVDCVTVPKEVYLPNVAMDKAKMAIEAFVENATAETKNNIFSAISKRPLYVMYESSLGCDPAYDHEEPKDVLPIFARPIRSCVDKLREELLSWLGQAIPDAVRTYSKTLAESAAKYKEAYETSAAQSDTLGAKLGLSLVQQKANDDRYGMDREQLLKELALLREQLYGRGRLGEHYRPDFGPDRSDWVTPDEVQARLEAQAKRLQEGFEERESGLLARLERAKKALTDAAEETTALRRQVKAQGDELEALRADGDTAVERAVRARLMEQEAELMRAQTERDNVQRELDLLRELYESERARSGGMSGVWEEQQKTNADAQGRCQKLQSDLSAAMAQVRDSQREQKLAELRVQQMEMEMASLRATQESLERSSTAKAAQITRLEALVKTLSSHRRPSVSERGEQSIGSQGAADKAVQTLEEKLNRVKGQLTEIITAPRDQTSNYAEDLRSLNEEFEREKRQIAAEIAANEKDHSRKVAALSNRISELEQLLAEQGINTGMSNTAGRNFGAGSQRDKGGKQGTAPTTGGNTSGRNRAGVSLPNAVRHKSPSSSRTSFSDFSPSSSKPQGERPPRVSGADEAAERADQRSSRGKGSDGVVGSGANRLQDGGRGFGANGGGRGEGGEFESVPRGIGAGADGSDGALMAQYGIERIEDVDYDMSSPNTSSSPVSRSHSPGSKHNQGSGRQQGDGIGWNGKKFQPTQSSLPFSDKDNRETFVYNNYDPILIRKRYVPAADLIPDGDVRHLTSLYDRCLILLDKARAKIAAMEEERTYNNMRILAALGLLCGEEELNAIQGMMITSQQMGASSQTHQKEGVNTTASFGDTSVDVGIDQQQRQLELGRAEGGDVEAAQAANSFPSSLIGSGIIGTNSLGVRSGLGLDASSHRPESGLVAACCTTSPFVNTLMAVEPLQKVQANSRVSEVLGDTRGLRQAVSASGSRNNRVSPSPLPNQSFRVPSAMKLIPYSELEQRLRGVAGSGSNTNLSACGTAANSRPGTGTSRPQEIWDGSLAGGTPIGKILVRPSTEVGSAREPKTSSTPRYPGNMTDIGVAARQADDVITFEGNTTEEFQERNSADGRGSLPILSSRGQKERIPMQSSTIPLITARPVLSGRGSSLLPSQLKPSSHQQTREQMLHTSRQSARSSSGSMRRPSSVASLSRYSSIQQFRTMAMNEDEFGRRKMEVERRLSPPRFRGARSRVTAGPVDHLNNEQTINVEGYSTPSGCKTILKMIDEAAIPTLHRMVVVTPEEQ